MLLNKKLTLSMLLFSITIRGLNAQEVIPASGGSATGNGGTASYSIGQIAYVYLSGSSGSVSPGIMYTYEISTINSVEQLKEIDLNYSVYPNPANHYLMLKVEEPLTGLYWQILDLNGKLLDSRTIENKENIIPFESRIPSTYILTISRGREIIKLFKIIKK